MSGEGFPNPYRGRIAPSPTGLLHLGHAQTFWTAWVRSQAASGVLILRNEDLDRDRACLKFAEAQRRDLAWLGIRWDEGPDLEGPVGPYSQSQRLGLYQSVYRQLQSTGHLFPCTCSRRDIASAIAAPHALDEEPIYSGRCRQRSPTDAVGLGSKSLQTSWRFRVPEGEEVIFEDALMGRQSWVAGRDFGDFVVMRHDGVPAYQLACVADDHAMGITEVVRGADLLVSTARQILLYRVLGWKPPQFAHCPLVTDAQGVRLAKRNGALSLETFRGQGWTPERLRAIWSKSTEGYGLSIKP